MHTVFLLLVVLCISIFSVGCFTVWYIRYLTRRYHDGKSSIWYQTFVPYPSQSSSLCLTSNDEVLAINQPGTIIHRNFITENMPTRPRDDREVMIMSINIEMGKQLQRIIDLFKTLQPDIILLQEVDMCTKRNKGIDEIREIAMALNMDSLFIPESIFDVGCEGNAILSSFPLSNYKAMPLMCQREPKHKYKKHFGCTATVETPWGSIGCCSIHIDTHCGALGRINQYKDLIPQMLQQKEDYALKYQAIGGDFNTLCHGVVRVIPMLTPDGYSRYKTFGYTEAEWFQEHAVSACNEKYNLGLCDPFNKRLDTTTTMFGGIYKGKLDWCLFTADSMDLVTKRVGTRLEMVSDHQWLYIVVRM